MMYGNHIVSKRLHFVKVNLQYISQSNYNILLMLEKMEFPYFRLQYLFVQKKEKAYTYLKKGRIPISRIKRFMSSKMIFIL